MNYIYYVFFSDDLIGGNLSSKGSRGSEEILLPKDNDLDNNLLALEAGDILEEGCWSSVENSPHPGPFRSASLRDRSGSNRRVVTFNPTITRQSSLPTGGVGMSDNDLQESDSWGSHLDIQGESVQIRKKPIQR